MTKEQLKSEISEMEAVLNDASTPNDVKDILREAIRTAKAELRGLERQEEAQKKEEKQLEAKAEGIKKDMTKAKTPEAKKKLSTTLEKAKQQLSKKKEEGKQKKKKAESKLSQQVAKAKGILKKASAKSQKFNAGRSQDNLKRDSERKAKPIGYRTSANGNRYWEGRANRSDVDRRKMPYLEDGGLINPVDADPLKIASELYEDGGMVREARVQLFNVLKNYKKGDFVAYKDVDGNYTKAGTIEKVQTQDGVEVYSVGGASYVASELRPVIFVGSEVYEHGGELQSVAENINVFGYQTENFNLCPKAVEQFEKAINAFELERDMESGYWKIQTESLSMCAKNADAIIGLHQRAAKGEGIDTVDVKMMVNSLQYFAIFNYKSGLKINGDFLENHVEGMFSHKIMFEFGGAILPLTNGTLSDPRFNIDSSQFYEAGGNILNEDTVGRVENMELADPAAYEKGGRIKEMVNHWNKYGWAGSSTDNDDSEFFKMIGRTQFDTPVTSFTGNDVKYYDDERVMPVSGGFRKFNSVSELDDYRDAVKRGLESQYWEQRGVDYYGKYNWDKLTEEEKNTVIGDIQSQFQRQYRAYAKGGKVGFDDKVKAISGNLEGKKVKPKYQRKYGKRYSHKEAVEAARNIAGSMRKKEMKYSVGGKIPYSKKQRDSMKKVYGLTDEEIDYKETMNYILKNTKGEEYKKALDEYDKSSVHQKIKSVMTQK